MPYSIVHIDLALQKNRELSLKWQDLLDFLVWNILVDTSYNLAKFGIELPRSDTHYYPCENYFIADFPNNFYIQELENNGKKYLRLGYYYHLLLDKFRRDNEISEIYTDDEVRNAFQISRKLNAQVDFEKFLENTDSKKIILDLYSYKFDKYKLPKVLHSIDEKILKKVFHNILDYMTGKNHFTKWERSHKTDEIINEHFNYEKHLDFKTKALKEIKI